MPSNFLFLLSLLLHIGDSYNAGPAKKIFWAITICLTVSAFLYNVSGIAKSFARFPVSVSITLLHENELIFPAVTVCNMSPVRKSAMESSAAFEEEVEKRKKRKKKKRRRKRSTGGFSVVLHTHPRPHLCTPHINVVKFVMVY